jgi:hypothetical protein
LEIARAGKCEAGVGDRTAESYANDKIDLIRAMEWDPYGDLLVFLEFTRDRNGESRLTIRDPSGQTPAIRVPIDAAAWKEAVTAWQRYADALGHQGPRRFECVLADGPMDIAEAVFGGGVSRAKTTDTDSCSPMPEFNLIGAFVTEAAGLVPFCADLHLGGGTDQIDACLRLAGNRFVASRVLDVAQVFYFDSLNCTDKDALDRIVPRFASGAVLRIEGKTIAGAAQSAAAWLAFTCDDRHLAFSRVYSTLHATIISGLVTMVISHPNGGEALAYAKSSQTWQRGPKGDFVLTSWSVGEFGPEQEQ